MEEPSSATAITRRLGSLVGEMGSDGADENAAGAEADDGLALLEELGEMGGRLGIGDIAAANAIGRVDFAVQFGLELTGQAAGPKCRE